VESLRGKLLIAAPALADPNFARTVVLIGEHTDDEGALGVVLNRPAPATVVDTIPALAPLVGPDDQLFVGGPVQPTDVVVLAEFVDPARAGLLVVENVGFLMGAVNADIVDAIARARIFAGYAGWGEGQLEAEIAMGSWYVEPALPSDVFASDPDGLWSDVLTRMGPRYALVATMPLDPSLN
jgi:putative transcriptional regulator